MVLPILVACEKKLKTGERIVPRRVVWGGLLAASTEASSLPFGFKGLPLHVIGSRRNKYIHRGAESYKVLLHGRINAEVKCNDDVPLLGLFRLTRETVLLARPRVCGAEVMKSLLSLQSMRLLLAGISGST